MLYTPLHNGASYIYCLYQEGNTFCTTLEPRLFTIDVNIVEHNVFFTEVSLRIGTGVMGVTVEVGMIGKDRYEYMSTSDLM